MSVIRDVMNTMLPERPPRAQLPRARARLPRPRPPRAQLPRPRRPPRAQLPRSQLRPQLRVRRRLGRPRSSPEGPGQSIDCRVERACWAFDATLSWFSYLKAPNLEFKTLLCLPGGQRLSEDLRLGSQNLCKSNLGKICCISNCKGIPNEYVD